MRTHHHAGGGEIRDEYDLAVVGAGPAGLAAASLCGRSGLSTVVFDEQAGPGGHFYRAITATPLRGGSVAGSDYWRGGRLVREFLGSGAHYVAGARVTGITSQRAVTVRAGDESRQVRCAWVLLATGSRERAFPIPGANLPGVMAAGDAQAQLLTSGRVPAGRTLLAGTGPLLWLVARQLLDAGATIPAMLDTTPRENRARAMPHLAGFVFSPYLRKAMELLLAVRSKLAIVSGVSELSAAGGARLEGVTYRTPDGGRHTIPADTLLLHQGVIPEVTLSRSLGLEHRWDDRQLCWFPAADLRGATPVAGISIAGDAGRIIGGQAAAWHGVLAAVDILQALKPGPSRPVEKLAGTALAQFARGRAFLDTLFRPAPGS